MTHIPMSFMEHNFFSMVMFNLYINTYSIFFHPCGLAIDTSGGKKKKKNSPQFKCVACVSKTENKNDPHDKPIEPLGIVR